MEALWFETQHLDAKQITEIIHRSHREWIADPDQGHGYQDVDPDPDREYGSEEHLKRNRNKGAKYPQRNRP